MDKWKKVVPAAATQRELRLDALYREAARVFRWNGYHGTSLVDIADGLGVSKATLYHYVSNKQDLFYQCHVAAADQAIAAVNHNEKLNGFERLRVSIFNYVTSIINPDSLSVVVLEERSLTAKQLKAVIAKRDRFERDLRGVIVDGIADGSIGECDPKFAVFCILGAANWVTKWHRPDGAWKVDDIAKGVADFACRGMEAAKIHPLSDST